MSVDPATRKATADASNPRGSAWVSANAGSGKTYVLSQRVIRLLLAGCDPGRILCLTFTKAAAAEMAKRVFDRLAAWTALSDAKLSREIAEIEGSRPDARRLAEARRLFARALETPGGLKIQTIHAFCERLLHQFPFEANVAGHFEVLDGRDADALADQARRTVLARAAAAPDGPLGVALKAVLSSASDFIQEAAIRQFVLKRDRLRRWIAAADDLDAALLQLRRGLGLQPGESAASIRLAALDHCPFADEFPRLVSLLAQGGSNDQQSGERLAPILEAADDAARAEAYLDFWQTSDGKLRKTGGSFITKAVLNRWPGLADMLETELVRLTALTDRLAAAECYESTEAILRLADAAIAEYERLKTLRGLLDFEDLIVKTANLLEARGGAAAWVHYKLDRGIDHVLVDEAQDTNPRQWQVVRALVEEFFAGAGASANERTIFAVGDEKQSIYSFQGAIPAWFSRMRRDLGDRARAAGMAWADPELHLSFRSAPVVLAAVDAVFASPDAYKGLSGDAVAPVHSAHRMGHPGRVIVWPMIEPAEKAEPTDWTAPLDQLGEQSPEVRLANRIVRTIRGWLDRGEVIEATGKPITPGGILILCRIRGAQTDAINRALKQAKVPIAGADRLVLTEHIAVMDLMALGRAMLLPEDDLSLAAVLKSPLIGLDEDQLYAIAHGRRHTLADGLAVAAATVKGPFLAAWEQLEAWRKKAASLDPYAFYAGVLGPDGARRRFLRRLGPEAEDVIDEFLAEALRYEETSAPTLEGFIAWLEATESEVRRDTDTLRDEVRVMTVHGAKGLEVDIVFLVDAGVQPVHSSHDPRVLSLDDDRDGRPSPLVWMRAYRSMPQVVKDRVDAIREEGREEYRRLLYVAMTRARDRLIVCGTLKPQATDLAHGWHALVTAALGPGSIPHHAPDGAVEALEWRAGDAREAPAKPRQEAMDFLPRRPAWLDRPAPAAPPAPFRITPSTAIGGEPDPAVAAMRVRSFGGDRETRSALDRGRIVHRLLQSLPEVAPEARAAAAARYLAAFAGDGFGDAERREMQEQVLAILAEPAFAPVFAPGSRAEVDIVASIGGGRLVGRVDRLAVTDDRILIVDYKTNRPAPTGLADTPHEYVIQLALYREALSGVFPGKPVAAAILWTDRPALMEVPSTVLAEAAKSALAAMPGAPASPASPAGPAP